MPQNRKKIEREQFTLENVRQSLGMFSKSGYTWTIQKKIEPVISEWYAKSENRVDCGYL